MCSSNYWCPLFTVSKITSCVPEYNARQQAAGAARAYVWHGRHLLYLFISAVPEHDAPQSAAEFACGSEGCTYFWKVLRLKVCAQMEGGAEAHHQRLPTHSRLLIICVHLFVFLINACSTSKQHVWHGLFLSIEFSSTHKHYIKISSTCGTNL